MVITTCERFHTFWSRLRVYIGKTGKKNKRINHSIWTSISSSTYMSSVLSQLPQVSDSGLTWPTCLYLLIVFPIAFVWNIVKIKSICYSSTDVIEENYLKYRSASCKMWLKYRPVNTCVSNWYHYLMKSYVILLIYKNI